MFTFNKGRKQVVFLFGDCDFVVYARFLELLELQVSSDK